MDANHVNDVQGLAVAPGDPLDLRRFCYTGIMELITEWMKDRMAAATTPRNSGGEAPGSARPGEDGGRQVFFQSPITTFLVDQPRDLTCQICYQPGLEMRSSLGRTGERMPAIVPCGHVACLPCLGKWFEDNDECPVCRKRLVHGVCGHKIKVRPLISESLCLLPPTLARGGRIADKCLPCQCNDEMQIAVVSMQAIRIEIRLARADVAARGGGGAEAVAALEAAEGRFEQVMKSFMAERITRAMAEW